MADNAIWKADSDHSNGMRKWADNIYIAKFGSELEQIIVLTPPGHKPHILDQHYGIDVVLRFRNGMVITVQEKFRHPDKIPYADMTLEVTNNKNGDQGEWYHMCAELYLYGYGLPETGFEVAYLLKMLEVKADIIYGRLQGHDGQNEKHSTAKFKGFYWDQIDIQHIIYQQGPIIHRTMRPRIEQT